MLKDDLSDDRASHFQRPDDRHIDYEPDEQLLEALPYFSDDVLEGLGLQPWDEDHEVWLFPVEWYEHIPKGFEITTIFERVKEFDPEEDTKEARFGALPFGISRPYYEPETGLEQWKKDKDET